ncbi:hypothetical protein NDU88_007679 [Pleurodeles waltl]|uniref:Uncharacterized protein n=1 Tax=Pleurodeles waltl TaxID=8319 RepID=A0AAV7VQE4_PLEWA|nr:hypothetical protein NDU88_007679 [Pleurodeles waltl]
MGRNSISDPHMAFTARSTPRSGGDTSSRLLALLLKGDRQQSPIGAIKLDKGEMASTQKEINGAFREYYVNLYAKRASSTPTQLTAFLAGSQLAQLSQGDAEKLEAPLSVAELNVTIAQMPRNKAP